MSVIIFVFLYLQVGRQSRTDDTTFQGHSESDASIGNNNIYMNKEMAQLTLPLFVSITVFIDLFLCLSFQNEPQWFSFHISALAWFLFSSLSLFLVFLFVFALFKPFSFS